MVKNNSPLYLLLFLSLSLFSMEIIVRLSNGATHVFSIGFVLSLLFSIVGACVIFLAANLFSTKTNHTLHVLFLMLTGFIYASQFIYAQFFRTYYTVYSVGNATQIIDFRTDIWLLIMENAFWLLLFFLPSLIIMIWGRRLFSFKKINGLYKGLVLCLLFIFHIAGLSTIWFSGQDLNSAYNLYFQNRDPVLSVDRLGVLTTMRLDAQRLITGWSPTHAPPEAPPTSPDTIPELLEQTEKVSLEEDVEIESDPDVQAEEDSEYNVLPIDFDELISLESDEQLIQMHRYFNNVEPTEKNDYTGKFEGYNLILLTAESFAPYAIHEEVTPTLHKMVQEGYNFTDFYVPLWDVSTSDGEYVTLTGLIPKSGVWSFSASSNLALPFVLGNQLNSLGYTTNAYHNHTYTYYDRHLSHPNLGYDYQGIGNGLEISGGWPRSDLEMLQETIPDYINDDLFHTYYMTVSGHMQYSFEGNNIAYKNRAYVEDLPYSEQAKAFLATQIELDKALEYLLQELEDAGVAERTLIVMATDHYPYGLDHTTIDELTGHEVDRDFELYKTPLIMYAKGLDPQTIDKPSSNLDVLPTLSNLFGLDYDSRLFMGTDIFSDSSPLVIFRNSSFITDQGIFNSVTNDFSPHDNSSNEDYGDYTDAVSSIIDNKFYYSIRILETDYYENFQ